MDRVWIKHFSVCCSYASIYKGCRDIATKIFEMVKNSNFFELFGPPCGNPLDNLDGSMPEFAQVCALHIELHLEALEKIKMVAVHSTNETVPHFFAF